MTLAELRAIDEARTPGPWEAEGCGIWLGITRDTPDGFDFEGRIYDEGGHTEADAMAIATHANTYPLLLAIAEAAAELMTRLQPESRLEADTALRAALDALEIA